MSHSCNPADRQASPRIFIESDQSHPLERSGQTFHGHCHCPTALLILFSRYQARADGVSLGTNRDRRLRHPALPEVWDPESGLDWTEASLLRHIRILIPLRFGRTAAPIIVAIISSKKGPGPSRWRPPSTCICTCTRAYLDSSLRWHISVSSCQEKLISPRRSSLRLPSPE